MNTTIYKPKTTEMVICERKRELIRIASPKDVFVALKQFHGKRQENFLVLTLDGAHQVIGIRIVTTGILNRTLVHPREVYSYAIIDNAAGIVVAHNHPSNCLTPSSEDVEVTQRLKAAGEILGIPLLDHIIFSKDGYLSFVERGIFDSSGLA